eukprot:m.140435 g.140435  ORF g.140435 m.140435 type:complete len:200 (-) comp10013_c0_seq3:104-703(-)
MSNCGQFLTLWTRFVIWCCWNTSCILPPHQGISPQHAKRTFTSPDSAHPQPRVYCFRTLPFDVHARVPRASCILNRAKLTVVACDSTQDAYFGIVEDDVHIEYGDAQRAPERRPDMDWLNKSTVSASREAAPAADGAATSATGVSTAEPVQDMSSIMDILNRGSNLVAAEAPAPMETEAQAQDEDDDDDDYLDDDDDDF